MLERYILGVLQKFVLKFDVFFLRSGSIRPTRNNIPTHHHNAMNTDMMAFVHPICRSENLNEEWTFWNKTTWIMPIENIPGRTITQKSPSQVLEISLFLFFRFKTYKFCWYRLFWIHLTEATSEKYRVWIKNFSRKYISLWEFQFQTRFFHN